MTRDPSRTIVQHAADALALVRPTPPAHTPLEDAVGAVLAAEKGFTISNVDASLVAEAPKVMKHAAAMKEKIAAALGIQPDQVGVKATTNERMGFIGREEGIAAMAVACVEK